MTLVEDSPGTFSCKWSSHTLDSTKGKIKLGARRWFKRSTAITTKASVFSEKIANFPTPMHRYFEISCMCYLHIRWQHWEEQYATAQTCIVHIHFKQKTHDTLRIAINWQEADQDLKPAFSLDLLFKGSPKGRVYLLTHSWVLFSRIQVLINISISQAGPKDNCSYSCRSCFDWKKCWNCFQLYPYAACFILPFSPTQL